MRTDLVDNLIYDNLDKGYNLKEIFEQMISNPSIAVADIAIAAKRHNFKVTEDFIEKCIQQALNFYNENFGEACEETRQLIRKNIAKSFIRFSSFKI